jgi:hypothetical protein
LKSEEPGTGPFTTKETIFAIASGITAIGFWGLAIDVALRSYIYESSVVVDANLGLWLFSAVFVIGLVAMGVSSMKRVGRAR